MSEKKFPLIRDVVYLSVIFLIILIFVVVFFIQDKINFDKNINFAATLSSIILAVVAIVYTMVEGVKTANSTSKVEKTADLIENTGYNIANFSSNLESINNTFVKGNLLEKVERLEGSLNKIEPRIDDLKKDLSQKIEKMNSDFFTHRQDIPEEKAIKKDKILEFIIENATIGELYLLYIIFYSAKNKKQININTITIKLSYLSHRILLGYGYLLRTIGIISLESIEEEKYEAAFLLGNIETVYKKIEDFSNTRTVLNTDESNDFLILKSIISNM